jgi:preprotein translocase subunit SecD
MSALAYLRDPRFSVLVAILLVLAVLVYVNHGLNLGIEFVGGSQIPVQLETAVNPATMNNVTAILQERLTTFGLKEVTVEGIGNSEVYVTIPNATSADVQRMIDVIESQGVFQGIVGGREAINGSDILSGSVGAAQPTLSSNVSWAVSFYITAPAASKFAKVVFGQANKPLYMFLDRPTRAAVLINSSVVSGAATQAGINQTTALQDMRQAMSLGNRTIAIETFGPGLGSAAAALAFFASNNALYRNVILADNTPAGLAANLTALNYTLDYVSVRNMTPSFSSATTQTGAETMVSSWPAVGLLSSPILNPGITNGTVEQSYQISGFAPSTLSPEAQLAYATNQSTLVTSILKGGALPVHVIVGTPTSIPATLGANSEFISIAAIVAAVIAVSIYIAFRYRKALLVVPILFTTMAELFIILSIIGLIGTIDLSAVAGMIAVVGTGVDAQIIITDEVLSGASEHTIKQKLGNAFFIVWADAGLLIVAMLPLLFSTTLITMIGFAESTVLGVLFGALITRPAYGYIISRHYLAPR